MQTRTVEQVESWDARPFSGGIRELHELADEEFSGTVVASDTWAFFLNGRVVGVFQGTIEDFRDASGTVYRAPDPSLPLLFSMHERGGETRAQYFTNDTSISEADRTLRDGNFVGYLELSENVLSGDYYVAYYGGKSMSAAFIGQSERLVTGEEAFEKADDEVGVFEVRTVPLDITDLPDRPEEAAADDDADTESSDPSRPAVEDSPEDGTVHHEDSSADTTERPETSPEATSHVESAEEPVETGDDSPDRSQPTEAPGPAEPASPGEQSADAPADMDAGNDDGRSPPREDDDPSETDSPDPESGATDSQSSVDSEMDDGLTDHERAVREWATKDRSEREDEPRQDLFREEAQWRETNSIPALDPDESATPGSGGSDSSTDTAAKQHVRSRSQEASEREGVDSDSRGSARAEKYRQLRSAIEERDRRIAELESDLDAAETEREDLEATVATLREERDALEERIDSLESELESARSVGASDRAAETDIPAAEALADTNLFIRYDSKGAATLDGLSDSSVDPEAVNDNLRLDHHTEFDEGDVTVDGRPFEEFLATSSRYRFVDWLVRELPYELIDSGATSGLQDVYDVIPSFDRVEFDGTVDVETESGETVSHAFDVVVRDRMGDPLVVAAINESRDAVLEGAMDELVTGATDIGEATDSLAGAFYVTASYFEPGALERAQDAADAGGFFSRSDKESYVKVSRKRGYHLCLVEDRRDAFHLTVPEL